MALWLSDEWQTTVRIGKARIGLFSRLVIDDLLVTDQSSDTMLVATRLSVKMSPWQLLRGRVRIANVQLFGYDIRLRRQQPEEPYNFQFIVDYFSSEDTTSTPLDLRINSVIIRRGSLSHDLDYEPRKEYFTPAHFKLEDLGLRGQIEAICEDSISFRLNDLSFKDSSSGLNVKDLEGSFRSSPHRTQVSDVSILLENSEIGIPSIILNGPLSEWQTADATADVNSLVTPRDLSAIVPALRNFSRPITIIAHAEKTGQDIELSQLHADSEGLLLEATGHAAMAKPDSAGSIPVKALHAKLQQFSVQAPLLQYIFEGLSQPVSKDSAPLLSPDLATMLSRLGNVQVTGTADYAPQVQELHTDLQVATSLGTAQLKGALTRQDLFNIQTEIQDFQLAGLLSTEQQFPVKSLTAELRAKGSLQQRSAQGTARVHDIHAFDTRFDDIETEFSMSPRKLISSTMFVDNEFGGLLTTNLQSAKDIQLTLAGLNNMEGVCKLKNVYVRRPEKNYDLRQLQLSLNNDDNGNHLLLSGDFIDAHADGHFRYEQLQPMVQQILHQAIPSVIKEPRENIKATDGHFSFSAQMWDCNQLMNLFDIPLQLPEAGYINGVVDLPRQSMILNAQVPHLEYDSEEIHAANLTFQQAGDSLRTALQLQRMMEEGPVDMALSIDGRRDHFNAQVSWDDHHQPAQRGQLITHTRFFTDEQQQIGFDTRVQSGQIVISDTLWDVHESHISFHKDYADIRGFQVSQAGRHLRIDGRASRMPEDTIYADLRGINLEYVFNLIDFHDVEFAGLATGKMRLHDPFNNLAIDAKLQVTDFTMNEGVLGTLNVTGGFGRKDENAIDLDGYIIEPEQGAISHVVALIKPGRAPGRGMELSVEAHHMNAYFINTFTDSFFSDVQGHASGHAYLHGPFRELDLEGNLTIDDAALTIDVLNTRYRIKPGGQVRLHDRGIEFKDLTVFDPIHDRNTDDWTDHSAQVNGELRYRHFKDIHYNFEMTAQNLQGYKFHDFGDEIFYGTIYGTGKATLSGEPGTLRVAVQCTPSSNSSFTYNAATTNSRTDNAFITFIDSSSPRHQGTSSSLSQKNETEEEDDEPLNIYIDFDLDVTRNAKVRLLMDPRTEDYITLYGDGHIRATYYNKGRFLMYGTYRVEEGNYKFSIQDVIRKEFRFKQGGTIVFGGSPMKADLNLQAVYTVPSVSLNDLAAGNNFSSTNVRVDCLMNIGGRAEQPQVTFDFDIPNVNEDEKQMVRSLISTEEERNMQVVYLLGIGRFYSYELDAGRSQTNAAMSSLLSTTLSGQVNELLSNMIGNGNWNFGTSLSTGNQGWNEVDVEGMLSGRLLNNRLLINGTFGYRDTPMANTNFIGDFDVQWLLTPSGNVRLKAYSETNDRYFTKTALTTQGIGIQVKKDFNSLSELFRFRSNKTQQ